MKQLEGRTAVVTGAASGIGLATTESLASRGVRVVMADFERETLEREADRLTRANLEVAPIWVDVADFASVQALAGAVAERYGDLHILFNNAGVSGGAPGPIWAQPQSEWDWVMGVNFRGVVNGLRAFVPAMLAHGDEAHIVNTSSILGLVTGGGSPYGVSKHAVTRLTEGLLFDLRAAGANIGVTLLCPGMVATNIITSARNKPDHLREADNAPDEARAQIRAATAARFHEQGMPAREVGEQVVEAILKDQFYVLTHARNMRGVRQRFEDIEHLRAPSLVNVLDD